MDRDETRQFRMLWIILAFVVCMIQVRPFVKNLLPMKGLSPDFFQEWVSARYYFEGLPIYAPLSLARERYREDMHDRPENITVGLLEYNGHPPTSVLLALPLAKMNYTSAHLVWTLLSLSALFAVVGTASRTNQSLRSLVRDGRVGGASFGTCVVGGLSDRDGRGHQTLSWICISLLRGETTRALPRRRRDGIPFVDRADRGDFGMGVLPRLCEGRFAVAPTVSCWLA
jgi:hypothetical protein